MAASAASGRESEDSHNGIYNEPPDRRAPRTPSMSREVELLQAARREEELRAIFIYISIAFRMFGFLILEIRRAVDMDKNRPLGKHIFIHIHCGLGFRRPFPKNPRRRGYGYKSCPQEWQFRLKLVDIKTDTAPAALACWAALSATPTSIRPAGMVPVQKLEPWMAPPAREMSRSRSTSPRRRTASEPKDKDKDKLPTGWSKVNSRGGQAYYWHEATRTSQYARPRGDPPPPGWTVEVSITSGQPYYWHKATQTSQVERPYK